MAFSYPVNSSHQGEQQNSGMENPTYTSKDITHELVARQGSPSREFPNPIYGNDVTDDPGSEHSTQFPGSDHTYSLCAPGEASYAEVNEVRNNRCVNVAGADMSEEYAYVGSPPTARHYEVPVQTMVRESDNVC